MDKHHVKFRNFVQTLIDVNIKFNISRERFAADFSAFMEYLKMYNI